jgi:hypothetical protein
MTKKLLGRPPSELPTRGKQVSCYLTNDDAVWLTELARDCGFKSRSELMATILERLVMCRFQGIGALRLVAQITARMDEINPARSSQSTLDFYSPFRPLPALPEVNFTPQEFKATLEDIKQQYKNER